MTFSVDVYLTPGSGEITFLDNDVASLVTVDGGPASYWEHIVAVTDDGCEVLDLRAGEDVSWARPSPTAMPARASAATHREGTARRGEPLVPLEEAVGLDGSTVEQP